MIRDLEVLLLTISDPESRAYVQEAVHCYSAGAYRAAVVLAVAAGMDGLRQRMRELATSGAAPQPVIDASKQIELRAAAQEAFESNLIDAAETAASFLTPAEAGKARVVLKTRHLCAHPSGHRGSAEEARDVITAVVDLVLSRPATLGMSGVTTLAARLESQAFFPKSADDVHAQSVVAAELALLHPTLLSALTTRLYGVLTPRAAGAPATTAEQNALTFLRAMTRAGDGARAAVWRYAEWLLHAPGATTDALQLITADPAGLALTGALVRDRFVATVRRGLATPPARAAARALADSGTLSGVERTEFVSAAVETLLTGPVARRAMLEAVAALGITEVAAAYFERLVAECASTTWETANPAIDFVQGLAIADAALVPPTARVDYVLGVADNGGRTYPAHSARAVVRRGLGDRADFIDALIEAVGADGERLRKADTRWDMVRAICAASERPDADCALVSLFEGPQASSIESVGTALKMLRKIATAEADPLASQARTVADALAMQLAADDEE